MCVAKPDGKISNGSGHAAAKGYEFGRRLPAKQKVKRKRKEGRRVPGDLRHLAGHDFAHPSTGNGKYECSLVLRWAKWSR